MRALLIPDSKIERGTAIPTPEAAASVPPGQYVRIVLDTGAVTVVSGNDGVTRIYSGSGGGRDYRLGPAQGATVDALLAKLPLPKADPSDPSTSWEVAKAVLIAGGWGPGPIHDPIVGTTPLLEAMDNPSAFFAGMNQPDSQADSSTAVTVSEAAPLATSIPPVAGHDETTKVS